MRPDPGLVLVLAAAGAALYVLKKAADLPATATNADGQRVTAYEGAGAIGIAGAAANAASGGWLATAGQRLGDMVYDLTHPAVSAGNPTPTTGDLSRADRYAAANPWTLGAPGWEGLPQP